MSRTAERHAKMMATFWRNPRVRRLSDGAVATFCMALSYCADQLNDGVMTADEALTMCARGKRASVKELVTEGFWAEHEAGTYEVLGYLSHNMSREQLEASRAAMSRGGRKRAGKQPPPDNPTKPARYLATDDASEPASTAASKRREEKRSPCSPPGDITTIGAPEPQGHSVEALLDRPATGRTAWALLEAISQRHTVAGRVVALPGLMPSANDLTKLEAAVRGLENDPDMSPLNVLAVEWLALLSLIAADEMQPPRGPMVPYFVACLAQRQLDERRRELGIPLLPAVSEAA